MATDIPPSRACSPTTVRTPPCEGRAFLNRLVALDDSTRLRTGGRVDDSRRVGAVSACDIEIRAYTDGWLHLYRADELKSGQELVTPRCAVLAPFYGVDHERALISEPTQRGEIHPGCLTPPPVVPAQDPTATVVLPALTKAIRGQL